MTYGWREVYSSLTSCLSLVIGGLVIGFSSPTEEEIRLTFHLDDNGLSWFGSLALLGAAFGGIICHFTMDRFGRKITLLLSGVPYTIGWFVIVTAVNTPMLYTGRAISGLSLGITLPLASVYISEIASPNMRGSLSACTNIGLLLGLFLVYTLGLFLPSRWLAVFCLVLTLLSVIFITTIPETPRYLIFKGELAEGHDTMAWLRGPDAQFKQEIQMIIEETDKEARCKSEISQFIKPLVQMCILIFLAEMTGSIVIFTYGERLLEECGFSAQPGVPLVFLALTRVIFSAMASSLVDKLGRRPLLIGSAVFMALGEFATGLNFYLKGDLKWLSLVGLFVQLMAFSVGWGPVPWILQGEMFAADARAISCTLSSFVCWFSGFLLTKWVWAVGYYIQMYGVFWLFSAISLFSVVYAYLFVNETKGKSLEEISMDRKCHLKNETTTLKSDFEESKEQRTRYVSTL